MENRFKLAHTGVGKQQPVGWPPFLPEHTDLFPSGKRKSGFPPKVRNRNFQSDCANLEHVCITGAGWLPEKCWVHFWPTWKPGWRWVARTQRAMRNAECTVSTWVTASSRSTISPPPSPNLCFSLYLWLFSPLPGFTFSKTQWKMQLKVSPGVSGFPLKLMPHFFSLIFKF